MNEDKDENLASISCLKPSVAAKVPKWIGEFCASLPDVLGEGVDAVNNPRTSSCGPQKRPRFTASSPGPQTTRAGGVVPSFPQEEPLPNEVAIDAMDGGIANVEVLDELSELERERSMHQAGLDADNAALEKFVSCLEKFVRRVDFAVSMQSASYDAACIKATANSRLLSEVHQAILVHSEVGAIVHVPVHLLSQVIAIMDVRVRKSEVACSQLLKRPIPKQIITEASLGAQAAAIVLSIMTAPKVPRKVIVEETLDEVVSLLRTASNRVVYPICDPLYEIPDQGRATPRNGMSQYTPTRRNRDCESVAMPDGANVDRDAGGERDFAKPRQVAVSQGGRDLIEHCSLLYDVLSDLLRKENHLSDSLASRIATIGVKSLGVTGLSHLQASAVKAVTAVFAGYPTHGYSILDDLRDQLGRVPAARRNLRGYRVLGEDHAEVRVGSALLVLLINQAGAQSAASAPNSKGKQANVASTSDVTLPQRRQDQATKLAMHFLKDMLSRAFRERDVEYRAAVQAMFEDLLVLYGKPEWPGAEHLLQTLSFQVITKLRVCGKEKLSVYARGLCIDMLGALAARMCALFGERVVKGVNSLTPSQIHEHRVCLLSYLQGEARSSVSHEVAMRFYESWFCTDDAKVGKEKAKRATCADDDDDEETVLDEGIAEKEKGNVQDAAQRMKRAAAVMERASNLEFGLRADAVNAALQLSEHRSFGRGFGAILHAILDAVHDAAPTIRTKSIRALSAVNDVCPGFLRSIPNALTVVEGCCRDVSTLVRDAALALFSGSVLLLPSKNAELPTICESIDIDLFDRAFPVIQKRLMDSATSVRKRAIHIMRNVVSVVLAKLESGRRRSSRGQVGFVNAQALEKRITDVCRCLVVRLVDTETSVREAAEKTLRLALFGFDPSEDMLVDQHQEPSAAASRFANRLTAVFLVLKSSSAQHDFLSRTVDRAMLKKQPSLFIAVVSSVVEQLHDYEARIAALYPKDTADRPLAENDVLRMRDLALRRVACASILSCFSAVDASLVAPHCGALSPSIKGIVSGPNSESLSSAKWNAAYAQMMKECDLLCAQRILSVLELGIPNMEKVEEKYLEEVISDVEVIVLQSPNSLLEDASVRCLCAVGAHANSDRSRDALARVASEFMRFTKEHVINLEGTAGVTTRDKTACRAIMRLGLLARYNQVSAVLNPEEIYGAIEHICQRFVKSWQDNGLCQSKAEDTGPNLMLQSAVGALTHFLIRHRSYLQRGTQTLVACIQQGELTQGQHLNAGQYHVVDTEVQLAVLSGFHEMLRDEEDRNTSVKDTEHVHAGRHSAKKERPSAVEAEAEAAERAAVPMLAAEEDAEAGYLALCAQEMIPELCRVASSRNPSVRLVVSNILGLLVRQGLVLPASVVPSLFGLLLDEHLRCRDGALRVVSFLADRHLQMLASAASPAIRECFARALASHRSLDRSKSPADVINSIAVDEDTGHSLLSAAIIVMRRDQRRGVLDSLMREFDPRVVVYRDAQNRGQEVDCRPSSELSGEKANGVNVQGANGNGDDEDDDDDVAANNCSSLRIEPGRNLCALSTLAFFAVTLATIDFSNGAGVGGSLTQGGGTATAEAKLKAAREDVQDLIGVATRILSNSGQAVLSAAKQVMRPNCNDLKSKAVISECAVRLSTLLQLKHHLKVVRFETATSGADAETEADVVESVEAAVRMPSFKFGDLTLATSAGCHDPLLPVATESVMMAQLELFRRLMREDSIDDADVAAPTRRTSRSSRNGIRRRSSTQKTASKTRSRATPKTGNHDSRPHRRATPGKRLRFENEPEGQDDDGGYTPN